jgi:uridine nucleosidase
LLAAHHPELNLLGVSTSHGNAHLPDTTDNTSRILTALGRTDIHVYPGASKPFCRPEVFTPVIHGATGLSGPQWLPEPLAPIRTDVKAIVAAADALLAQPVKTAWIVVTGPTTNVALLFATFPEVAEHIAGLSIMGGAVGEGFTGVPSGKTLGQSEGFGNETPWAEFNIYCAEFLCSDRLTN